MALKKEITNNKGVIADYHKIGNFSIKKTNNEEYVICVQVLSFVSEEYRRISQANNVINTNYIVRANIREISSISIYKLIYGKLKELKTFKGSEDC